MSHADLVTNLLLNPVVAEVVDATPELGLPDCFVAAGCLAQTVWNVKHGRDPVADIKDIDIVYFDPDLSETREREHQERVRRQFPGLPLALDVKNEARVHLWYERSFGYPISPYESVESAIETFPTTATAIGIRKGDYGYEVFAPFGVDDLLDLVVRPNKVQITQGIYASKVRRWKAIWPKLEVVPWHTDQ